MRERRNMEMKWVDEKMGGGGTDATDGKRETGKTADKENGKVVVVV